MKLILIITFSFIISVIRSETHTHYLSPKYILENDVVSLPDAAAAAPQPQPLMVPLTLIHGADSKGAGFFFSPTHTIIINIAFPLL
jgi:hypothetical protein